MEVAALSFPSPASPSLPLPLPFPEGAVLDFSAAGLDFGAMIDECAAGISGSGQDHW